MKIKISKEEADIINEMLEHPVVEGEHKPTFNIIKNNKEIIIEASTDDINNLREIVGIYLTYCGFDENYEPTIKGLTLENLIDKFYVG